ncbi:PAS domain-containing protein [Polyangium jinanense]|uniref:PAS domain-containing protein n=1 Tax=Polyangium jinanense TaxID=2829994 RepID=A0A9X4AQT4_9BACT|nr:PAS domain-containing protein [Polyangium jinanense]MDC3954805.1 PAS domain-containing protein [Polyangium jinanense]MDC3981424.1 PAS domain-containing protein [Polyangium jinanense]
MYLPMENEYAALRARVAELEARLAARSPVATNGHHREAIPADHEAETRLLRAALHNLADAVVICNREGRTIHFNAAATQIFGELSREVTSEALSTRYGLFYPDGVTHIPADELPSHRALRGESVDGIELVVRREGLPACLYVECSARCIRDASGAICGAVVVCRDLGERRRYEAERERRLRAEEERLAAENERLRMARILRSLLDHLDIIVWATDEKGVFTFHDGRGAESAGLARGWLVGKSAHEVYPDDMLIHRALSAGVPGHDRNEAHGVAWEHWAIPMNDDGKPSGVIGLSLNVTEAYHVKLELEAKLALIQRQQEVIFNLETPIIQVWDRVLTLPMVGVVDSQRAARVTDNVLAEVSRTQARFAILDLTGVDVVDTATAGHILNIIAAVRLLGAEGIITGIRPNIAQTMISLGLDLSRVRTLATLRDGLSLVIRELNGAAGGRFGAGAQKARSSRPG